MEFLANHNKLILLGTVILAIFLIGLQYLTSIVSDYKAQKDQAVLRSDNKVLKEEVKSLIEQNVALIKQVSVLDNKADLLNQIGTNQLLATFYTEELSQPIKNMWFRIVFNKMIPFSDLQPLNFAIELSFDPYNSQTTRFYVLDAGVRIKNDDSGKDVAVSGYRIISGSLKKNGEDVYSEMFAPAKETIEDIVIPISLMNHGTMTLKHFQENSIIVFLPDSIINIAERIEFIINGWAILNQPISSAVWVKNPDRYSWEHVGNIGHLKRSAANDPKIAPAYSLWKINLFQGIPLKYSGIPGGVSPQISHTYRKLKKEEITKLSEQS